MAHGTPDFWGAAPKATTYGLADMAELAVRLGSVVNYDRRGEVLWASGFEEGGRAFQSTGTGTGSEIYLSCDDVGDGGLCLVLKTGDAAGNWRIISRNTHYPELGGIGNEVSIEPGPNFLEMILSMELYSGSDYTQYRCKYTHATGVISVLHSDGAYHDVATTEKLGTSGYTWSQFKLVCDTLTGKYVRVLINKHTYDASAFAGLSAASVNTPVLSPSFRVYNTAAGACKVSFDNWIITHNEPA